MINERALIRNAARRIARAADAAVADLREGLVEQEPQLTDRMLGRIMESINGYQSKGVRWTAKTLTDRGRGAQESRFGADFVGVLDIDLPEFKVKKGFLAQAKLLRSGGMSKVEFNRMLPQCDQMLQLSPDSFVFVQSMDGIRVVPAIEVVGAANAAVAFDPAAHYSRSLSRFYEEHFGCFIGDRAIDRPTEQTLRDLQARSLLYLAARTSIS